MAELPSLSMSLGTAGIYWGGLSQVRALCGTYRADSVAESPRDVITGPPQGARVDSGVPGGGSYRDEEIQLWTFNDDGKVCRLRHYVDTAKHIAAWQG